MDIPGALARLERSPGVPGPWGLWPSCPGCVAWGTRQWRLPFIAWERQAPLLHVALQLGASEDQGGTELPDTTWPPELGDLGSFIEHLLHARHWAGFEDTRVDITQAIGERRPMPANSYDLPRD